MAATCVAVPWEIHQVERRGRSARDPIDIDEPRFSGRGAGARETLSNERIDQARFADVRSSDERNFREAVAQQVFRDGGTANEGGFEFQEVWLVG
jgi:hypothetical protein